MNEEKISVHQQVMDAAYKLWDNHKNWDSKMFFDHLTYVEKVAVALGNLNYQVENGGFSQWGFNGYAENHFDFLSRLEVNVDKYPKLVKALSIVSKAYPNVPASSQFSDEDANEETENVLDECDTEYYEIEGLEDEMEKFITELQTQS